MYRLISAIDGQMVRLPVCLPACLPATPFCMVGHVHVCSWVCDGPGGCVCRVPVTWCGVRGDDVQIKEIQAEPQ